MYKSKINLNKKQKILISIIILFITSISVITLAFFKSTDEVANRLHSPESPKIILSEPNWYSEGKSLAEQSVPGTMFPKDPCVTNLSNYNVYIRMRIEILNESGIEVEDERKKAILKSIYCLDENSFSKFLTFTVDNDTLNIESNNPNFFYHDGYFYYGTSTDNLTSLSPNDKTPTLFDAVITPHDESYTSYFEEPFSIEVFAEAIYVIEDNEDFYDIVNRFERS